ncbi:CD1375 family protein [Robertmurraya massiliosenegalensis]|uniref:CD1375 family protein n=1 Tax=Robertmurraya TaxID=2837507 RepID=UPI0039A66DD6
MNKVQEMLVNSYATLVMAKKMAITDVPEKKVISGVEMPIRSEVEIEIAERTIEVLG